MKTIALIGLSLILLVSMAGCGNPLKPGEYEGSNPSIFLNLTTEGIENLIISVPFNGGKCTFRSLEVIKLGADGSFSYQVQVNSILIDNISGKVNGDKVSGSYSIKFCMGGGLSAITPAAQGKWTANFKGPLPTVMATTVPPKLGHFEGENPSVTFDLANGPSGAGLEVNNLKVVLVGNDPSCNFLPLSGMELINDGNGSFFFSYGGGANMAGFSGRISGENASGTYNDYCNHNGEWTAKWVNP